MKINTQKIQAELQELAGNASVKIKLDKHIDVASSIRESDKGYVIKLNPNKFRVPKKLEEHLQLFRDSVVRSEDK